MVNVLEKNAPLQSIFNWLVTFKRGRTDISDEARNGRPKNGINEEMINSIDERVLDIKRMTTYEIAEDVGISNE